LKGEKALVPGVHCAKAVGVSTDMKIDGKGDENSVFIIQISKTLAVATNVQITLMGKAQAKNIFWAVAESVSLEVGSHTEGMDMYVFIYD
jgi:hypothetical protein